MSEFDYFEFQLKFRGSPEEVKERMRVHVARFADCENVLDLGCGRGEFLELLREAGISAGGVDREPRMVEACLGRGLDVVEADALSHLASLEDESIGGVFTAHLIEHVPHEAQVRLINLCRVKLRPGSPIVIETPNPLSLAALPHELTLDPTHQKLVHPQLLTFMLTSAGFSVVEVVALQPFAPTNLLEPVNADRLGDPSTPDWVKALNRNFARLNQLLFRPQDYAVVARKPAPHPRVRKRKSAR